MLLETDGRIAFGRALGRISPGTAAPVGYNAKGGQEDAMKPGTRVLVVEDDRSIARLLELEFEHNGLAVRCAYDGPTGLELAREFGPSVIVLDIMLPLMDGVCVLKRLRQRGERAAVVMLTARDAVPDKVHSLKLGADDYITKPFSTEELLARMGALLRRTEGDEVLWVGDLCIDTASREVRRDERSIELTAREYELLEFMARNPRRVLSRGLLLSRVWGQDSGIETNVVDVYVGYLERSSTRRASP